MAAKRGRPPKDDADKYTENKTFRLSQEQIDKIEAEASRRRQATDKNVYMADIIRFLIDTYLPDADGENGDPHPA